MLPSARRATLVASALLLCLFAAVRPAAADLAQDIARVKSLIRSLQIDKAKSLLSDLQAQWPDSDDVAFLRAFVAMQEGDPAAAIPLYRAMLDRDPSLARVRLELARAYFLAGDDAKAQHHFELALNGDLPPEVEDKVRAFLREIRRRKEWSVQFAIGLMPDSNVTTAPEDFPGWLPYVAELSWLNNLTAKPDEDSQKTSDIGVAVSFSGEYAPALTDSLRLRLGGGVSRVEYNLDRLDTMTLSAVAGPRLVLGDAQVSLVGVAERRWLGDKPYDYALGGRFEMSWLVTPRLRFDASVERLERDFEESDGLDGPETTISAAARFGLTPQSFVSLSGEWARDEGELDHLRNTRFGFGVAYHRLLPAGFAVQVQPRIEATWYDAPWKGWFWQERHDVVLGGRLTMTNSRLDFRGFAPALGYSYANRDSNIDINDYERHRFEVWLTRVF